MEQNFQTSFIPKKPVIETKTTGGGRPVGILLVISILLFLTMSLASGGAYFYRETLKSSITKMQNDLVLAKGRFEPSQITKLRLLDNRLQSASEVLSKHITIHPIFELLQAVTLKTVMYKNFGYTINEKTNRIDVKMSGQGVGYRSIALQSDLFSKNKNFIDPIFSNLSLDDKGNVLFDLGFSVDMNFLAYKQVIKTEKDNSSLGTNPVIINNNTNPATSGSQN